MFRLAYITTHPIQYQAPLLRLIAASGAVDLRVFFLSDLSLHAHHEAAFGRTFKWDVPLTEGYAWELLPRWGIGHSTALRPWWPVRGLPQKFKQGHFDAVWVHGWGHIGLRQALRAARQSGLPVLLRGETTPDGSRATGWKRWWRDRYCRKIIQQAAACLCIGSRNREFYREMGATAAKLFHVPYAVDNAWFQARCAEAAPRREALRAELGLATGRPVILFAAKFIPVKAAGDLIQAYQSAWDQKRKAESGKQKAEMGNGKPEGENRKSEIGNRKSEMGKQKSEAKPRPYLLLVGDGPLRAELEAQAGVMNGNDIRFLGFKNQTELPALYDLCDVFALPSHFEPWGLVINEAMNAGKPVIVSDRVGAAPDLVEHGVNGWIFPQGDVAALSGCLAGAFNGGDLTAMGRRSLEIINQWNFDADLRGLLTALEAVCPLKK